MMNSRTTRKYLTLLLFGAIILTGWQKVTDFFLYQYLTNQLMNSIQLQDEYSSPYLFDIGHPSRSFSFNNFDGVGQKLEFFTKKANSPRADYYLGQSYYWDDNYSQAVVAFDESANEESINSLSNLYLGYSYWKLDQKGLAINSWKENPDLISSHFLIKALIAEQDNDYLSAKEFYDIAFQLRPNDQNAYASFLYAQAMFMLANSSKENNSLLYEEVYETNQKNNWRMVNFGKALFDIQEISLAEKAFKAAILNGPASPWPYYYLGRVHYDKGNYFEAEEALQVSLEISPNFARSHFWLARALRKDDNRLGETLHHYQQAVQYLPNYDPYLQELKEFETLSNNDANDKH